VRTTPLALLALLAAGCVHPGEDPDAAFAGFTEDAAEPAVEREVVVTYDGPIEEPDAPPTATALPAPSPAHAILDPVPFRLGAGCGALGHIDLGACRDQGLQPGYVHMRVTFHHSGRVASAALESLASPPPEALTCIGEQLEVAMVPAFDGGDVVLSKSYFVN
jgi:hypothetical protein